MAKVLGIFGFLQFGVADILDIAMVALLVFFLLRSIRGDSTVINIVLVLTLLLVAQVVASVLNMRMMTVLLNALLDVGVLAIIIIFQPEIRHLLNRFAMQTGISRRTGDLFNRLLGIKEERLGSRSVEELAEAVRAMSAEKTGALIVIQHKSSMDEFIGLTEDTDADVIVVSEETGGVRFVRNGEAREVESMQELRQLLQGAMDPAKDEPGKEE